MANSKSKTIKFKRHTIIASFEEKLLINVGCPKTWEVFVKKGNKILKIENYKENSYCSEEIAKFAAQEMTKLYPLEEFVVLKI